MLATDFLNQPYFAEVLKMSGPDGEKGSSAIETLLDGRWKKDSIKEDDDEITVHHGYVASPVAYHRSFRNRSIEGVEMHYPRTRLIRKKEYFLYDLLLLSRRRHLIVAVPFHGLATNLFLDIDNVLAGTRTLYETVNITNMVIQLGLQGRIMRPNQDGSSTEILVTRCHLAFSDPVTRQRNLEQVRLTGLNVGASEIYSQLVEPVLKPAESEKVVTPILLGFALVKNGVRKSSATTDRHGNFKVTVGPGLRQIIRLFALLDEIEKLQNVASTSPNVPILQSTSIKEAG